jgi:cytochrome P450
MPPAGLSYNWLLGRFMVFSTDAEVSRKMLNVNDPSSLLMAVHPSAKDILGPNNLAFMHGPAHKAIRKSFLALFTRCAARQKSLCWHSSQYSALMTCNAGGNWHAWVFCSAWLY